jgi:hypothetical protein
MFELLAASRLSVAIVRLAAGQEMPAAARIAAIRLLAASLGNVADFLAAAIS